MKFYGILHRTVLLQSKLIKYLWKVLQWITIQLDPERLKEKSVKRFAVFILL